MGFVYALQQVDGGPNQIYGFRFDSTTGALTLLGGFPMSSGGTGTAAASSEHLSYVDGRLYVVNDGSNTLTAFSVDGTTGALTAMPFSPIALGAGSWACVDAHPSGSPVIVGNGDGGMASFSVTSSTATAAAGSPFSTDSANPYSCEFSQDGAYVYTGGNLGTALAAFSVNTATGVLSTFGGGPDFGVSSAFPLAYATDASGRLFLAGASSQLLAFRTVTGTPVSVSGNPFASGLTTAAHGVLHPRGFYMVADRTGNRIGSYQIAGIDAATTLTPVAGSPFSAGGTLTNALALTVDGAHLVAANGTSRNLTVFAVNQNTGTLQFLGVQPANTLGASGVISGLAFAASEPGFFYTLQQVNGGPNQIHGFRINPSTGALMPLAGFPISSGGNGTNTVYSEHIAYSNGRLYVVNDGSDTLSMFKVNQTTGALTPLASPVPLGPGAWACAAAHPRGSPVIVGRGEGGVASFVVTSTASAAPGSPFGTSTALPYSCRFSTEGNYLFTGGGGFIGNNATAVFAVDAASGILYPMLGSPFDSGATNPMAYATDGTGRLFLHNVFNGSVGLVRAFMAYTGIASGGNPYPSELMLGVHGVYHPAGYYLVADRGGNRVGMYQVGGSGASTSLSAAASSPFAAGGTLTNALALTDDGRFLIASNAETRNLTVFAVRPSTPSSNPTLTSISTQPAGTLGAQGYISGLAFAPFMPPFIDDPVIAASGVIRAIHITELRRRIDAVRARYGMLPYSYGDPELAAGLAVIRAADVSELRAALGEVYSATGIVPPSYTDAALTNGTTVVKAVHITELRTAVIAIE